MGVLDLFTLEGKKALVTGGGQGIGRGFCLALAEAGADVAVVDVNDVTAAAVAEEVRAMGRNAVAIKTDVTVPDDVEEMALIVEEDLGGLDIAVNNAGIGRPGTAEGMTKANWDLTIAINLTGVFLCCQAEAQIMIPQRKGKIINTASISGIMANAVVAYGASKAGVIMLTKRMAAEWGKHNITVNCLSPSWTITPMTDRVPDETKKRWKDLTPLGRVEVPEDMYGALVFLASDASNYVTGQNLVVDGGHTLSVWIDGAP
jgi:NAD(P)-dependent dehydrogenase (short-subunit alcohol dehydrogenase family)